MQNKLIKIQLQNSKAATVSQKGVVKRVKAGTASITVRADNGKKATIKIKVISQQESNPKKKQQR